MGLTIEVLDRVELSKEEEGLCQVKKARKPLPRPHSPTMGHGVHHRQTMVNIAPFFCSFSRAGCQGPCHWTRADRAEKKC